MVEEKKLAHGVCRNHKMVKKRMQAQDSPWGKAETSVVEVDQPDVCNMDPSCPGVGNLLPGRLHPGRMVEKAASGAGHAGFYQVSRAMAPARRTA